MWATTCMTQISFLAFSNILLKQKRIITVGGCMCFTHVSICKNYGIMETGWSPAYILSSFCSTTGNTFPPSLCWTPCPAFYTINIPQIESCPYLFSSRYMKKKPQLWLDVQQYLPSAYLAPHSHLIFILERTVFDYVMDKNDESTKMKQQ